jgi:adenosylhomocysteinase
MEWAWRYMPILNEIKNKYSNEQPFKGCKMVVCCHLEAKTANLALLFKDTGAEVWVTGSNPLSTQDEIVAALENHYHMVVHAKHTENNEEFRKNLYKVLELRPNLIMDDGGDLSTIVHTEIKEYLKELKGISEETTTGVHRLRALEREGYLKVPAIAANNAQMKYLFDNRYGTGQSVWDGIIRTTNLAICGKVVVVAGYGWCGKGVAGKARGLGARVIVTEIDPIKALEAIMDGFEVMPMESAAPAGDFFVTVTGNINVVAPKHFDLLKDGAVLSNAGHFDVEVAVGALRKYAVKSWEAKPNIQGYQLPNGKSVFVVGSGRLVNIAAADGHPIEIMDGSFGVQYLSMLYLWQNRDNLEPKLFDTPIEIDTELAFLKLRSLHKEIDTLTDEQQKYLNSW